jgi:hypothetical protein
MSVAKLVNGDGRGTWMGVDWTQPAYVWKDLRVARGLRQSRWAGSRTRSRLDLSQPRAERGVARGMPRNINFVARRVFSD